MKSYVLNRLYSSGGTEILHGTLEITDGKARHFLTDGYEDLEVGLETGGLATLSPAAYRLRFLREAAMGSKT